jgi:hypothetical protein
MKVCIMFHSVTGSTRQFAERIAGALHKDGHTVDLHPLQTDVPVKTGSIRQPMNFQLLNLPDVSGYDAVLAGAPVWGFSVAPVAYKALMELPGLAGKRFLPFITMGMFARGMGGTVSAKQLAKAAMKNGANVLPGAAIVPKMFHDYQVLMDCEAEKIRALLRS